MTNQELFESFLSREGKVYGTIKSYSTALSGFVSDRIRQYDENIKSIYDVTDVEKLEELLGLLKNDSEYNAKDTHNRYSSPFRRYIKYVRSIQRQEELNINIQKRPTEQMESHQIIYYGAPGTGKSHKIKKELEARNVPKANIFRTTFHPDSDYSTFVGAYKPTMKRSQRITILSKSRLMDILMGYKNKGDIYPCQRFAAKYWQSIQKLSPIEIKDILSECDFPDSMYTEIKKGVAVGRELGEIKSNDTIIYSFVAQTFLQAYIRAYQTNEDVYLVIEEINRGNCAQIFGDLFQLLDRNERGKSDFTIKADADLRAFLEEELGADRPGIKDGELCLPPNLYIYATMNTSDQSLFPIDSAFKRRWDWEYEPIKYKNKDWKIVIDNAAYSWVSFQKEVNKRIKEATSSEDKMLGDYFVNPSNGVVTEKMLLNKVLFYLWNDVCKDGEGDIFKTSESDEVSFSELFGEGGKQKLIQMMEYLGVEKLD